jgi:hypothetical protein
VRPDSAGNSEASDGSDGRDEEPGSACVFEVDVPQLQGTAA